MQSNRKNRFHSSQTYQQDDNHGYLSPFLRSSRSPSHLEPKPPSKQPSTPAAELITDRIEIQELRSHYECIEKVLNEENANLKKQAKYLASEMRKTLKREKLYKEELAKANTIYQRACQRLEEVEQENAEMKEYVQSKIIILVNALKLTHLHDLQEELRKVIQQFCHYFSISLQLKNFTKNDKLSSQQQSQHPSQNQIEGYHQLTIKIQSLNDKFESLMSEFKSTNRPQIRKQCIDIAKQIKQLKSQQQGLNEGSRLEKTVQNLSRIQSRDYLSVKSKNSKNVFQMDDDRRESLVNTDEKAFIRNPTRKASRRDTYLSQDRPASFRLPSQKY